MYVAYPHTQCAYTEYCKYSRRLQKYLLEELSIPPAIHIMTYPPAGLSTRLTWLLTIL